MGRPLPGTSHKVLRTGLHFLWMSCDVVGCHRMFLGQGIWLSCGVQKAGNGCQRIFKGDFNGCPMTSYGQGMSQSTFKGL